MTTGWRTVPFTAMGTAWEDEVWVKGGRSRVHFYTRGAGAVSEVKQRREQELNTQVHIIAT